MKILKYISSDDLANHQTFELNVTNKFSMTINTLTVFLLAQHFTDT